MARHRRRALLAVVAAVVPLVVVVMPVTATAARIRIRCHDGDTSCDLDQTRDGKCTFLLPAGPFCCGSGGVSLRVSFQERGGKGPQAACPENRVRQVPVCAAYRSSSRPGTSLTLPHASAASDPGA